MRKKDAAHAIPKRSHRLLTLSAAILFLPAMAWSDPISNITINDQTVDTDTDVIGTDPIGSATNGLIIKGGNNIATTPSNNNNVKVTDSLTDYSVAGGGGFDSNATGNTVEIIKGAISGAVVGGVSGVTPAHDEVSAGNGGNATGNTVTIDTTADGGDDVTVGAQVTGGASQKGNANGNTVSIMGTTEKTVEITGSVYGGAADAVDTPVTDSFGGGNADNNSVTIGTGTSVTGNVRGGGTYNGNASGNTVSVNTSGTIMGTVTGGITTTGNTIKNTVQIDGGTYTGHIVGGEVDHTGTASGNKVTITTGITTNGGSLGSVFGGKGGAHSDTSTNVDVSDNTVTLGAADATGVVTVAGTVAGGQTETGNASSNKVNIVGSTQAVTTGVVFGGQSDKGNASTNTVTVTGANLESDAANIVTGTVIGGQAAGGAEEATSNANRNTVTITGGTGSINIDGITGGDAKNVGDASGNKVSITSNLSGIVKAYGTGDAFVIGGSAVTGNASNNNVSISGSANTSITAKDAIGGSVTTAGDASGNEVSIDGGTFSGVVTGGTTANGAASGNKVAITRGAITGVVKGGESTLGDVSGNQLTIGGEEATTVITGQAYGAYATAGDASGNQVTVNGGKLDGGVLGAYSTAGDVTNNSVTVNGGTIATGAYGGSSAKGIVTGNHLTINKGSVTGTITGGAATAADDEANSSNNSVTINGGSIEDSSVIAGAYITSSSNNNVLTATGNKVTLSGEVTVGTSVKLSGVAVSSTDYSADSTLSGNTLEVRDFKSEGTFSSISGFQSYNFILSSAPTGAVLKTTDLALGDDAKLTLTFTGDNAALKAGDGLTLINSSNSPTGSFATTAVASQGATLQYGLAVATNGNDISATVTNSGLKQESKTLSEGYLAGVALLTQGADLAVDKGIAAAVKASEAGFQGFAAAGGGSLRYDTGSHVQVDGFSLLAGLSFGTGLAPGKLTFGAFFEYGQGDYDTSNSFASGKVKGSGDTEYTGGGLLVRFDATETEAGHFYGEATGRVGNVETDFSSSGLQNAQGQKAKYDTDGTYYGVHLGAGYVWKLSGQSKLDLYGKYLWSRQEGDSLRLNTGDPVKFDDVDSHRLRVGARLDWNATDSLSPYVGLAYEHEFDGEAKATAYGQAIDAPELKGGTAIGELGLSFKAGKAVTLDVGVQGYTGKRDGATGSLKLKIAF